MAQQLTASIYGKDGYDWNTPMGITRGFPVQGITIEQVSQPVVYSGVTCNAIITLLANGLQVNGEKFYTPTAASTLITTSNA